VTSHGQLYFRARHGEVERVVRHILAAESSAGFHSPDELAVAARFRQREVVAELCRWVTGGDGLRAGAAGTKASFAAMSLERSGGSEC